VEITDRTVQSRFLLVLSAEINDIILGVLGRAQRLNGVGLCGFVFLSNHFHLLLRARRPIPAGSFPPGLPFVTGLPPSCVPG